MLPHVVQGLVACVALHYSHTMDSVSQCAKLTTMLVVQHMGLI